MSFKNFYKTYQGPINTVVLVGAGFIAYSIYKSNQKKKELDQARQGAAAAQTELQALAAQGVHPSYADSQFLIFVNQLVQAMTGCGTDEAAVQNVFRNMRNEADIRKLLITFDIQYYQPCVWTSPVSYARWQLDDHAFGGDLSTWLGYDLSSGDIEDINSILSGNGISYRF